MLLPQAHVSADSGALKNMVLRICGSEPDVSPDLFSANWFSGVSLVRVTYWPRMAGAACWDIPDGAVVGSAHARSRRAPVAISSPPARSSCLSSSVTPCAERRAMRGDGQLARIHDGKRAPHLPRTPRAGDGRLVRAMQARNQGAQLRGAKVCSCTKVGCGGKWRLACTQTIPHVVSPARIFQGRTVALRRRLFLLYIARCNLRGVSYVVKNM